MLATTERNPTNHNHPSGRATNQLDEILRSLRRELTGDGCGIPTSSTVGRTLMLALKRKLAASGAHRRHLAPAATCLKMLVKVNTR